MTQRGDKKKAIMVVGFWLALAAASLALTFTVKPNDNQKLFFLNSPQTDLFFDAYNRYGVFRTMLVGVKTNGVLLSKNAEKLKKLSEKIENSLCKYFRRDFIFEILL